MLDDAEGSDATTILCSLQATADLEISQKLTLQLGVKLFMFGAVFYTRTHSFSPWDW